MEKDIKKPPPAPGGLDEDQAMAAFSEFVSNGGGVIDKPDPVRAAAEKKKKDDSQYEIQETGKKAFTEEDVLKIVDFKTFNTTTTVEKK